MKHLFYLIAIIFIIYEMAWLFNPKSQLEKIKNFRELNKKEGKSKWSEMSEEFKDCMKGYVLPKLVLLVWMLVGLFTLSPKKKMAVGLL